MNTEPTEQPPAPAKTWLEKLASLLLREPHDRKEVIELLRHAVQRELLNAQALTMIEGVLQVSDMKVRDIMVPRSQMVVVEQDATPQEFLPLIIDSGHSRFPIIGDNRDEVIGILLAKDLLAYGFQTTQAQINLKDIVRPATFIPESKRLDILLQEFRINHHHMAVVVDEYGGIAGLVTIEDVLEQIVGDIEDEYDVDEDIFIKQRSDTQYVIKALTPIEDFNEYFDVEFSDNEYDTIGGLIMQAFGYLPKKGESITVLPFRFKVLQADNRRIQLVRATVLKKLLKGTVPTTPAEPKTAKDEKANAGPY